MRTIITIIAVFSLLHINAQTVTNVTATQTGDQVQINYQLIGFQSPQHIEILCSTDGGNTFNTPVRSATGDIGANVMPGGNKTVTWNVLNDVPSIHTSNAVFKVTATQAGSGGGFSGFNLDFEGIKMNVYEIKRSGKSVIFLFKLTSEGKDRDAAMHKNSIRMIDADGNVYDKEINISLATKENTYYVKENLVSGIPMKGNIRFSNIPESVRNIALLEVKVNNTTRQQRSITLP
jgi:hypothetical protein